MTNYYEIFVIGSLFIMYLRSQNIVVTMIVFFSMMFFIEVIASTLLFGQEFSPQAVKFDTLNVVSYVLIGFLAIVFIVNYKISTDTNIQYGDIFKFRYSDIPPFFLIFSFALFVLVTKGNRLDGSFVDFVGVRSILEDYLALVMIFVLFINKGRMLIFLPYVMLIFAYLIAGERMRVFIYFLPLFFIYTSKQNTIAFKSTLFFLFFVATYISSLRSGFIDNGEFNVTHFGSVTISSMYLMDYSLTLQSLENFFYGVGMFLGNLIPSYILPEGLDIRRDLVLYYDIPGGGWFPLWIYAIGGPIFFIIVSVLISLMIRSFSIGMNKYRFSGNHALFLFFIVFCATLPRWFMYTPYQFFRFPLYILIIYISYLTIKKYLLNTHE